MDLAQQRSDAVGRVEPQNPFLPLMSAWSLASAGAPEASSLAPVTTWVASWRFCPN